MPEYNTFSDFALNKQLLSAIEELGYTQPTAIQQKAIPAVLGGNHIMGIAQTGTGKTAAYTLPLLMRLKYAQGDAPRAVIIVPTRELALQVFESIRQLGKFTDLRCVCAYGGVGPKSQIEELDKGTDFLIATPGRFLELYAEGHIVLKQVKHMVLDEADRLMDMGFIRQIHRILEIVPRKRQSLLFSATMSELVRKISGDFMEFPTIIEVEPEQKTASTVSQTVYNVPNIKTKVNIVAHLLEQAEVFKKVIIFCRTRTTADKLFNYIERKFSPDECRVIHANKGQSTRINSINTFRDGDVRILVATDVAARGIDVTQVSHVINFDVPIVYEDYIHRIGRTGRAFQTGESITFVTPAEEYHFKKIEKLIKQTVPEVLVDKQFIEEITPFDERQAMAREIDAQRKKEDPSYQGAFHEKRVVRKKKPKKGHTAKASSKRPEGKKSNKKK